MTKKWRCTLCGYIHTGGDSPPEECPVCKAAKEKFEEYKPKE